MAVTLRLKNSHTIPISLKGIIPERLSQLGRQEIGRLTVRRGNQLATLSELYHFDACDPSDGILELQGDHSTCNSIGRRMSGGTIIVDGDAGDQTGIQISGGKIIVRGSTGSYAGAEMSGGHIEIEGNAADWLAGALPGSKTGMREGTIEIAGDVGHGAGFRMRRGCVSISGNTGRRLGWQMRAGTIIAGKAVAAECGKRMTRGTIILTSSSDSDANTHQLPITFSGGGDTDPVFINLMKRQSPQLFNGIPSQSYVLFHGDHLEGARGEILIAASY